MRTARKRPARAAADTRRRQRGRRATAERAAAGRAVGRRRSDSTPAPRSGPGLAGRAVPRRRSASTLTDLELRVLRPRPAPRGDSRGCRRQCEAARRLPIGHARPDHPEPGMGACTARVTAGTRTWGWSWASLLQPVSVSSDAGGRTPTTTGWKSGGAACCAAGPKGLRATARRA